MMSESEKKQLLNSLSDAIKECQLRFGGKRELATEMDGRVCFLCLKLEAIFLHGLKKTPNNLGTSHHATGQPSLLANSGAQINSMIKNNSILKSTGNLISHFFDDSKLPYAQQIKSNIESLAINTQNEITFWPFVKNFMSRFDIERFELLGNIKTDIGRQRAWIRCCLNEHCLEKYTLAILANPNLIRDSYDENSFLLDKNYTTPFPMLLSGLQSILFAINLDNPNLNIPTKLNTNNQQSSVSNASKSSNSSSKGSEQTSSPIKITEKGDSSTTSTLPMSSSFNGNSLATIETTTVKLRKKASLTSTAPIVLGNNNNNNTSTTSNTSNRRVRKNNVVVSDDDPPPPTSHKQIDSANKNREDEEEQLTNGHNEFDFTVSENETTTASSQLMSSSKKPEFTILTNPIKYSRNESPTSNSSLTDTTTTTPAAVSNKTRSVRESDESLASSSEKAANEFADNCNLIPINSSSFNLTNNSNLVDTLSMNSYQSENSNDINFGQHLRSFDQNSPPVLSNDIVVGGMSPSSTPTMRSGQQSTTTATRLAADTDNLSPSELREVVLTMIGRKEQCEQVNRTLRASLNEEIAKNGGLAEKCQLLEKELSNSKQVYENRIQTIENENKLLKDQLKKYVSAVQMMRPNNNDTTAASVQPMPAFNPNLQRDYSYEAEQYEKKLIQVAEMHGELMEFNSRLHSIINYKTIQIERLKNELIELRGPLPLDLAMNNQVDDASTLDSIDSLSVNNLSTALISIWIPSAFLRSEKSGSHHVYQVYIRIKDEEWNIYRRFSHFHSLHSKLKEKYPIVSTLNFPKKKTIGNKDIKFVEGRRKLLQDYLRKIINLLLQVDRDLNSKPCRETLVKAIPFLSDQHFLPPNQSSNPTIVGGGAGGVVTSVGGGGVGGGGNIPISSSRSNLTSAVGSARNLSQLVRNPSNAFLNGASSPGSNRPNELLYTGL